MNRHVLFLASVCMVALASLASPRAAMASDDDAPEAHFDNATYLMGEKKYAEAVAEFRAAVKADPRYKNAWEGLANAFRAQGKADKAARAQAMADAAPASRGGAAPALTAEQTEALGLESAPAETPKVTETGTFDDVVFTPLAATEWKSAVVGDNLVFSLDVPKPEQFTVTIFASGDCIGTAGDFEEGFTDMIDAIVSAKPGQRGAKRQPIERLAGKGVEAALRRRVAVNATTKVTIDAFGFLKNARVNVVALEYTDGVPSLEDRRRTAEAFVLGFAFTAAADRAARPAGVYVADVASMRPTVERNVKEAMPAASPEELASRVESELKRWAAENGRLELKADGTYAQTRALAPGADGATGESVDSGRWALFRTQLSLQRLAVDGVVRPTALTFIGEYDRSGKLEVVGSLYVRKP